MALRVDADRRYHLSTLVPVALLISGFMGYAGITLVSLSFQDVKTFDINSGRYAGLVNYAAAFADPETGGAIAHSLFWIFGSVATTAALGISVGLFLSRETVIVRLTRSLLLLPWVLPGVVAAATWKWMYQTNNGILNMLLIEWGVIQVGVPWLGQVRTVLPAVMLVMSWRLFPLFALVVASATKTIDPTLYEAARLDGADRWQVVRHVTLPGIRQHAVTMMLLTTIWVANNLVFVQVMTGGGPLNASEILPTRVYELAFHANDLGASAVVSLINAAIIALIGILYVRTLRTLPAEA